MTKSKVKDWDNVSGEMQLLKNDLVIREHKYQTVTDRRRILRIWNSEEKLNDTDYELIIKPN